MPSPAPPGYPSLLRGRSLALPPSLVELKPRFGDGGGNYGSPGWKNKLTLSASVIKNICLIRALEDLARVPKNVRCQKPIVSPGRFSTGREGQSIISGPRGLRPVGAQEEKYRSASDRQQAGGAPAPSSPRRPLPEPPATLTSISESAGPAPASEEAAWAATPSGPPLLLLLLPLLAAEAAGLEGALSGGGDGGGSAADDMMFRLRHRLLPEAGHGTEEAA